MRFFVITLVAASASLQHAAYPIDPVTVLSTPVAVRSIAVDAAHPGFVDIASMAGVVMGIEVAPQEAQNPLSTEVVLQAPITVAGALERLQSLFAGYGTTTRDGVLNVAPSALLDDRADFLNARVARFDVHDVPLRDAVVAWRKLVQPNYQWAGSLHTGGRSDEMTRRQVVLNTALAAHVSVSVENTSVRGVLNAIARASGLVIWTINYQGVSARGDQADLTITAIGGSSDTFGPIGS